MVPGEKALSRCSEGSVFRKAYLSVEGNKPEDFKCDTGTIKGLVDKGRISDNEYLDFRAMLYAPGAAVHAWSVQLSGGYRDARRPDGWHQARVVQRRQEGNHRSLRGQSILDSAAGVALQTGRDHPQSTAVHHLAASPAFGKEVWPEPECVASKSSRQIRTMNSDLSKLVV